MDSLSPFDNTQPDDVAQAGSTSIVINPAPDDSHQLDSVEPLGHGPKLEWMDWSIRLALVGLVAVTLSSQLLTRTSGNEGILTLAILTGLTGLYLLGSIEPVARRLYAVAQTDPIGMAFPPLLLLIPYIVLGRGTPGFDIASVLLCLVLVFLPVGLALTNTSHLRLSDIPVGLVAVAAPLVSPILRDQAITSADGVLRAGAFALPVLLLVFSTRAQKERMNFAFLCAVLALWYSVEFKAFPNLNLPGQSGDAPYFQLVVICAFLYVLVVAGRFGALGLSFKPSTRGLSIVTSNLALFALIAVPIGLATGFIKPALASAGLIENLARGFGIYLTIALPEEILFRGVLLSYLAATLRWPPIPTIVLSALVFGASHLNNPPGVGWYFILATIAGVFYARTYLATKNATAAAAVHTMVDWLWAVVFSG